MEVQNLMPDPVEDVAKAGVNVVKEIWSLLEAAAHKPAPSTYLGQKAVRAIQGERQDTQSPSEIG